MAAFNHFYGEELTAQTFNTDTNFSTLVTIAASGQLVANTKYAIVARGLFNGSNANQIFHMRVSTADDSTIATKSECIIEPDVPGDNRGQFYGFVHSFITSGTPVDIFLQFKTANTSHSVQADQLSFAVLDLDDISAPNLLGTHHFDASDAGPTDSGADWNNDAQAFNGVKTNAAVKANFETGALTGEGTTAPTTGSAIGEVWVRVTYKSSGGLVEFLIEEDSVGGTDLLGLTRLALSTTTRTSRDYLITVPSGGWTWQKINDLAISFTDGNDDGEINLAEIRVYDSNGKGYFETVHDADSSDYPVTQATEFSIAGADLGTDEWWVMAYQLTEINNTNNRFRVEAFAARDTSTSAVRAKDENEGEDTAEQRISFFSLVHKASSGTPDFELQTWRSGGSAPGNGGGYGIALKTSLFKDFVFDYQAGSASITTTEATFATISPDYSPSVTADHWLFGSWNQVLTTDTDRVTMHIEDDDVEMRVGDADIFMSAAYDDLATPLLGLFYQDNILSSDTSTYTLRGLASLTTDSVEHRWLIIVSLEKAAVVTAVYPPWPRRQLTTVRM